MMARSHIPFAVSCWWSVALLLNWPITGHSAVIAGVGGLLPDIDHPKSALGRRLPIISDAIAAIFGHRGFTHSLLASVLIFLGLLFVVTNAAYQHLQWMIAPLCIGYLSHILGDSFTPSGVPLFYPKKTTYSFKLFKTGSVKETIAVTIFALMLIVFGGVGERIVGHTVESLKYQIMALGQNHYPVFR